MNFYGILLYEITDSVKKWKLQNYNAYLLPNITLHYNTTKNFQHIVVSTCKNTRFDGSQIPKGRDYWCPHNLLVSTTSPCFQHPRFQVVNCFTKDTLFNKNKCRLSDYREKGMFDIPFLFIWAEWLEYNFGPVKLMKNPDNSHTSF